MSTESFTIGLSSWSYSWAVGVPGFPLPDQPADPFWLLDQARELGAEVLQLADNIPLDRMKLSELDELRQQAETAGITLEVGTTGLGRDNLLSYLEIARKLGSPLVRTLPHSADDRPDLTTARQRIAGVLSVFEAAEVRLGIENHDFYPASWIAELVSSFSSPYLGVCLDTVNNFGQGESASEVFSALSPYTINFHCKDYRIDRKPSKLGFDVTGTPTGQGFLDLNLALGCLPPGISWIIELWTPWQGDITSTAKLEAEWAKQSARHLKKFRNSCLTGNRRSHS